MNIFILDTDPRQCARMHCDKHVVKMILEHAQMMSTALVESGAEAPYKPTHKNHPCTIWTRESRQNYVWLYELTYFLNKEFKHRYSGKDHKSWLAVQCVDIPDLPDKGLTTFAQAMPDQYRHDDPVTAYRNYYRGDKARIATWTNRPEPEWFQLENV